MPDTVTLFSGEAFDLQNPGPDAIHLSDIALGLSNICRFGGHARFWWSVADHAMLVRDLVIEHGYAEVAFAALHHDSQETYLGDIPTGLKRLLGDPYGQLREGVDAAIGQALHVDPALFEHPVVVEADRAALYIEAAELLPTGTRGLLTPPPQFMSIEPRGLISPGPSRSRATFLETHEQERTLLV